MARTPSHVLSNNGLCLLSNNGSCVYMRSCRVRVTNFSVGGKFHLLSNFTEIHAPTLALYALLVTRPLEDATSRSFVGKIN